MRGKNATKEMVEIPKDEYRILKEIYKTVKRPTIRNQLCPFPDPAATEDKNSGRV